MSPIETRATTRSLHPAWIALAVTFLVLLSAAAVRATPGVLFLPLEQEFGWSRSTVSLAVSVNILLYGLVGPFAGALMQRLGVRRTTMIALSLLAAGVSLATLVTQPWQLVLLWGVVVGTGSGMAALVLGATIVNRWFVARRGMAMGILTASTATGQLIFLPVLAALIQRQPRTQLASRFRRFAMGSGLVISSCYHSRSSFAARRRMGSSALT